MRIPYYCPYCDQRSTRLWNLEVHIKRKHGGYLLGRSTDRHMENNSPLYSKSVQLGHATVADSAGSFQPGYIPQLAPLDVSQYYVNPMYQTGQIMNSQSHGTGLSEGVVQKIRELKSLMNKYPRYNPNPDGIIRWAIYNSINGDYTFLDNKLGQLRTIDRRLHG
jgi:hypothetical protein